MAGKMACATGRQSGSPYLPNPNPTVECSSLSLLQHPTSLRSSKLFTKLLDLLKDLLHGVFIARRVREGRAGEGLEVYRHIVQTIECSVALHSIDHARQDDGDGRKRGSLRPRDLLACVRLHRRGWTGARDPIGDIRHRFRAAGIEHHSRRRAPSPRPPRLPRCRAASRGGCGSRGRSSPRFRRRR